MRISLTVIVLLVLLGNALPQSSLAQTPEAEFGDFAGLVELPDGRSIYAECSGQGSPTVILISGYRTRADVWTEPLFDPLGNSPVVFPAIAQHTRVCAYDRPGTLSVIDDQRMPSRSDPVPMPRTADDAVQELRQLRLQIAGDEPVILVAHSFGGLLLRLYAAQWPEDVAGVVLVDAYSEFVQDNMTPEEFSAYAEFASEIPEFLADYIDYETLDFLASANDVRTATQGHPLPAVPLVILSKGQPFGLGDDPPGFSVDHFEAAWDIAQDELAALLPGTEHITVADSSHYIQLQQPQVVIEAIDQVIDSVRSNQPIVPSATP